MRAALICAISGQDGAYLARFLLKLGSPVFRTGSLGLGWFMPNWSLGRRLECKNANEWVSYKTVYVGATEARVLSSPINLVVLAANNVTIGLLPEQPSASVTARVPMLISRNDLNSQ